ncbi:SH3 domain-containing protein [Ruminococcaceae bacterium YRB3002]|nr:SH3 domain-containing protein [Ruminococcaceae bacterium YRB3002]
MVFKKNSKQHILALVVGAAIAVPVLALPIGVRAGIRPALAVSNAHKTIYGQIQEYDEIMSDDEQVVIEDWAIVGDDGLVDSTGMEDDEGTDPDDGSTPTDTDTPDDQQPAETDAHGTYNDVPSYTVYQEYDSASNLPIELLDPQYFAADDTQYYVKAQNTIMKQYPDMTTLTIKKMNLGEGVRRIGIGDTWSKVRTKDGEEGYILSNCITDEMVWVVTDITCWVDTGSLILREKPDTGSAPLKTLHDEARLHVIAYADKWYKVVTTDGTTGYVYKSFTTRKPPPTPTPTPTPRPTATKAPRGSYNGRTGNVNSLPKITGKNGESIVSIAASMLGVRYVYAGCSRSGIDCSGLVKYCYAQIGISVPHGANQICNRSGVKVARSDVALGDVICYDYGSKCKHVAIYAGGGQVIHASQSRGRVCYGNVDMMPIRAIKRLIR